jgi:hypothetical protein
MVPVSFSLFDAGLGLALVFLLWKIVSRSRFSQSRTYPPGPKGWPIIGNLLEMPKEKAWTVFTQLSKEYGASPFVVFMKYNVICYFQASSFISMFWESLLSSSTRTGSPLRCLTAKVQFTLIDRI